MTKYRLPPEKAWELVRRLSASAEAHEEATVEPGMAMGDMETLLASALSCMSRESLRDFWQTPDVSELIDGIPEYAELADEVYRRHPDVFDLVRRSEDADDDEPE